MRSRDEPTPEISISRTAHCGIKGFAGGDGKTPKEDKDFKTPIPKEWQDAAIATGKEKVLVDDGLLDLIWPDKQ